MADSLEISILIATHNRAEGLRQSLDAMRKLVADDLSFEIVLIDNNSSDHTRDVIESFEGALPMRYLFEEKPGKNCALNRALTEGRLGRLVVFMDDDISPDSNCLRAMIEMSSRWPQASVFGGRIKIEFPDAPIPEWAMNNRIHPFAFGLHHQPGGEGPYVTGVFPFGGLFWVRREVFDTGRRFNEAVGPRPRDRIMGSETTFLRQLADDGFTMIYGPDAVVTHRVQKELLCVRAMRTRAYRQGRGTAHWRGPVYDRLFQLHRLLWYPACMLRIVVAYMQIALSLLSLSSGVRVERSIKAIKKLGHAIESIRLAPQRSQGWKPVHNSA